MKRAVLVLLASALSVQSMVAIPSRDKPYRLLSKPEAPKFTLPEACFAALIIGGLIYINIRVRCYANHPVTSSPPLPPPPGYPDPIFPAPDTNQPPEEERSNVFLDGGFAESDLTYPDTTGNSVFTKCLSARLETSTGAEGPWAPIYNVAAWQSAAGTLVVLSYTNGVPIWTNYVALGATNFCPAWTGSLDEQKRFYRLTQ